MKIGMVLAGQSYPPDIRVEKEARALLQGGHEVVVFCDREPGEPGEGRWNGADVVRLHVPPRGIAKLLSLVHLATWRHPRWYRFLRRQVERRDIDVLHVHDLPMLATATDAAELAGIPVVADLHENYPEALEFYFPNRKTSRIRSWLFDTKRWQRHECETLRRVDHVVVVVDEARERLAQGGLPIDRVTVVENTEEVERFGGMSSNATARRDRFVLSYVGGFGGGHRGLATVIESLPAIVAGIPDVLLLLVGSGPIQETLERRVHELGLQAHVEFTGWQPLERVPYFIEASDVCLVPHESNAHTDATIPHKLFQYMLMAKPVVVSSCRPLKRIVENTGAGLVFEAGNPESLAHAILSLRDPELRKTLGETGRKAVVTGYNWRETSRNLLRIYDELAK